MSGGYRNNHYVPVWYQKRFFLPDQPSNELWYLDLNPGTFKDGRGQLVERRALKRLGPKYCFRERDLYTTTFGAADSTKLEELFFGSVDTDGAKAVDYFTRFAHPSADEEAFHGLVRYMSVQKLRTPKGLGWLAEQLRSGAKDHVLNMVVRLQQVFGAIWCESVWLIADASDTTTKFLVTDHPVTVYNRRCGPRSQWCRGCNDPDIRYHASHTIFPLSLERILVLTNLSWVRNPYQSEVGVRPNPNPWRASVFNFTSIQTRRQLREQEVLEINFILKRRALRYVAAAKEEWLYPELHVSKSGWADFGQGYLFMPDPRGINLGGKVMIGFRGGGSDSFDAYGRKPWQQDFDKEDRETTERRTLYRFKGEFAHLCGPTRRGRSYEFGRLDDGVDSEDYHKYHLSLFKKRERS